MSDPADTPEADRAEGAPHPRHAPRLVGHATAASDLAAALHAGRLHHAWLVTGPPGIGKATLAWQAARRLLSDRPAPDDAPLATDPADPVVRRILALSEPGLYLLRRPWDSKRKVLTTQIPVEAVRDLNRFFALSRPDGGRRVVIVDAAEEMNANAANALLKRLEEPPAETVFFLVSHVPSRLLPTIRSRCRVLKLAPLPEDEVAEALRLALPDLADPEPEALAGLAQGSVGRAVRMQLLDGPDLQRRLVALFAGMPGVDRAAAHRLAGDLATRGAEDRRTLALDLVADLLAALARHGATGGATGSATPLPADLARLAPDPAAARLWAATQQDLSARLRRGLALNLDPHGLILDMVLEIDRTAQTCAAVEGAPGS